MMFDLSTMKLSPNVLQIFNLLEITQYEELFQFPERIMAHKDKTIDVTVSGKLVKMSFMDFMHEVITSTDPKTDRYSVIIVLLIARIIYVSCSENIFAELG